MHLHLQQHQHVTFTVGKKHTVDGVRVKECKCQGISSKLYNFFSKCKINYNPMFYVFTNITFYVSTVILYYFPNNVHQLAYSKLLEIAPLTSYMQNSTSAEQT
jgi:hypothetical protein